MLMSQKAERVKSHKNSSMLEYISQSQFDELPSPRVLNTHFKIIDDANCNFCQKENETIEHIFWGCENVQNLLGQVNSWFGDKDINQTGVSMEREFT
jgi:hypothetical protein